MLCLVVAVIVLACYVSLAVCPAQPCPRPQACPPAGPPPLTPSLPRSSAFPRSRVRPHSPAPAFLPHALPPAFVCPRSRPRAEPRPDHLRVHRRRLLLGRQHRAHRRRLLPHLGHHCHQLGRVPPPHRHHLCPMAPAGPSPALRRAPSADATRPAHARTRTQTQTDAEVQAQLATGKRSDERAKELEALYFGAYEPGAPSPTGVRQNS